MKINFHVALMYDETEEDNGRATDDALEAFDKAYKSYIGPSAPNRDAYLQYQGRPVIFIFPKRGHTDWDRVRQQVNNGKILPGLFTKMNRQPNMQKISTASTHGFIPVPKVGLRTAASGARNILRTFTQKMKEDHPNQITVGGVWPGFDDSKASWGLNRHMDRRCGQTLEDTLAIAARYQNADSHAIPDDRDMERLRRRHSDRERSRELQRQQASSHPEEGSQVKHPKFMSLHHNSLSTTY